MKSPFTGGEVSLMTEAREMTFRKEKFSYIAHFYTCGDTGEQFTITELDELNINQVYNQYRAKYGIPFPDEISEIRSRYGLSATKMAEILGFGTNQYRLYENGEIPSEANGKLIKSIINPEVFALFVKNAEHQFEPKDYIKIVEKIERAKKLIDDPESKSRIFGSYQRSEINGYAPQSYSRLKNIILYLIEQCGGVFNTKMNKLLFYADFLSYKLRGVAMSGLAYKAIQYGPVPDRYSVVYGSIDDVYTEIVGFSSGNSGEKLCSFIQADIDSLSPKDIEILNNIVVRFKNCSSNEISTISHDEDAWIRYNGKKEYINFNEAFTLKAL